jgi:hypothetical protein
LLSSIRQRLAKEQESKKAAEAKPSDFVLGQAQVLQWLHANGASNLAQTYINQQAGRQQ